MSTLTGEAELVRKVDTDPMLVAGMQVKEGDNTLQIIVNCPHSQQCITFTLLAINDDKAS